MLYIGAEYCPYCAAERWSMIVALSRFGTFSGLTTIRSAAHERRRATPSRTRTPRPGRSCKSSYTSNYLTFTPVEEYTNIPDPSTGGYTTLQTPHGGAAGADQQVRRGQPGAIPFIDYGNKSPERRRVLRPRPC